MPKYRNQFGVVVDIPEEKAARIDGLVPVDPPPSPPQKTPPRKATKHAPDPA